MSELKEYIVTLNDKQDLDAFYDDMETPGGTLHIPDRAVDLVNRRPISRNTHYMLTDEEAEQIRNDSRVMAVEVHIRYTDIEILPAGSRTSSEWSKEYLNSLATSPTNFKNDKNWGLLRCVNGEQITNWGDNSGLFVSGSFTRPDTTTDVLEQTATVTINETGKNVDVVIVDGLIDPNHPEYAVNIDGTGGSRVVQYNWFQHNPTVTNSPAGVYDYTINSNPARYRLDGLYNSNHNHGSHVAGTVAGNSQGWAVDANIYNIYAYGSVNGMPDTLYTMFDYIREFHKNKPINPETGRRNPTITNNSYSFGRTQGSISEIKYLVYRGTTINGPFVEGTLLAPYGIASEQVRYSTHNDAIDADIVDAIADGIIVVAAAGNSNEKIDVVGGIDYDNFFYRQIAGQTTGTKHYYHRGATPAAAPGVIAVGAVDALSIDYQSYYSNNGPGVDVYAPGTNIISAQATKYSGFDFTLGQMSVTKGIVGPPAATTVRTTYVTTDSDFSGFFLTPPRPAYWKVTKDAAAPTSWDTGAYSRQYSVGGFGVTFEVLQTTAAMAIGMTLRPDPFLGDAITLSDLLYAFYIKADGTYQFIESGTVVGSSAAYTTSTRFEIWYYNSSVKYVVNGTVVRTVTGVSSELMMYIDSVMYTPGGSFAVYSTYPIKMVDPRNSDYFLNKINGTSMASPQVAGVLACVLQTYPNFTQTDCLNYITTYAKTNQITNVPSSDWSKRYDLNDAPNRYLYYYKERVDDGNVYPKKNFLPRSTSGTTYPRPRIRR